MQQGDGIVSRAGLPKFDYCKYTVNQRCFELDGYSSGFLVEFHSDMLLP